MIHLHILKVVFNILITLLTLLLYIAYMTFRTEINLEKSKQTILHNDKICLIGSCFTQNIGNKLSENGFHTDINPFGIIYNPISISQCLEHISTSEPLACNDLIKSGDYWKAYTHHGDFKAQSQEELLEIVNNKIADSYNFIVKAKYLIITLGTSWVYTHKETNRIMGNCHKLNSNLFTKTLLTIDQIVENMTNSIDIFFANNENSNSKVILTISPIRHWKDGYRENQLSKSILNLAVDELCKTNSKIEYFPSYEILMDDLRDYRFYNEDMLHPNNLAVEYIWEKFQDTYFNINTIELCKRFQHLQKMKNHRPFNPDGEAYKNHLQKIKDLEEELNSLLKS